MSHIVQINTEVRDADALSAACRRLGLPEPCRGKTQLFSGQVEGLLVRLSGWVYPVVVDLASGEIKFDNYEGRWGDPKLLDQLVQRYAVEKARLEARKRSHHVVEQSLADGSVKLIVQVGGVA